jgi:membrane protein
MFTVSVTIGLSTSSSLTSLITQKTLAAADRADDIPIIAMTVNWVFTCVLFFLAYKIIPNCEVRGNAARTGAILAGSLFYVISKLYTIYVTSFASYKNVYGTLAALPVFLLWIYVCWLILLTGALLAWRWQAGWPPLNEDKTLEDTVTSLDEHRNRGIRALLPSLTLISIYSKFQAGKGTDVATLVDELKLPYGWVHESVELLRELGFVARAKVTQPDKTEREQVLPTHPADTITLKQISDLTDRPVSEWLDAWEPGMSKSLKVFLERVKSHSSKTDNRTLDTLLS